jgi:hypothetical protein
MNRSRTLFQQLMRLPLSAAVVMIGNACATTGTAASGSTVIVWDASIGWKPSGCQELGEVIGRDGPSASPSEGLAKAQALDRALSLGATHMMTTSNGKAATSRGGELDWVYRGIAYRCPNATVHP